MTAPVHPYTKALLNAVPFPDLDRPLDFVKAGETSALASGSWAQAFRDDEARDALAPADLGADWLGGFYCPCHGSKFDLAGRVYSGVPAPANLPVPPFKFISANLVLIGDDK